VFVCTSHENFHNILPGPSSFFDIASNKTWGTTDVSFSLRFEDAHFFNVNIFFP
jgi:hypothetical protein